jgi:hypothetical protein
VFGPRWIINPHLRAAAFWGSLALGGASKGTAMKRLLVAAVIAASFFSFEANAQERAGSAALGAVSGAVVFGPVGAVAGALIGFTAGPAIAHSWGVGHSNSRSRTRVATQANAGTQEAVKGTPLPVAKPVDAGAAKPAPPVAKSPQIAATKTAPPVQALE